MKFAVAVNAISSQSLSIFILLLGVGLFVLAAHTADHDGGYRSDYGRVCVAEDERHKNGGENER
jgi:hypothetical protein